MTNNFRAPENAPGAAFGNLRVAIVHYWFLGYAGGERVVSALLDIFPQADLFAIFADGRTSARFAPHRITTSFLQKIPGSHRFHRHLLPLIPIALEQFDLREYDLVISSESGPAKGVLTPANTLHINYCHSPMRYIWDLYQEYTNGKDMSGITRKVFMGVSHYMRMWDLASASRVDYFAANSNNIAARIRKTYRRDATVIYPPVDVASAYLSDRIDDYYLFVGRLVDYKRVDLAVQACTRLGRPLRVVGDGPQYKRLRQIAGPSITFLGELGEAELREQFAHCRALLFPGNDDFGIVPVEAQSFGRPVIAYGRGGALETILCTPINGAVDPELSTGIFFGEQKPESLEPAILELESIESGFSPQAIRNHVHQFDISRFHVGMGDFVERCMAEHLGVAAPVEPAIAMSAKLRQ